MPRRKQEDARKTKQFGRAGCRWGCLLMGLFDYVRCEMPLPECPEWATEFQSKDTPCQFMDRYEIREDGTLWHQDCDYEDRSNPSAKGPLMRLRGSMTPVNKRWVRVEGFDGAVYFGSWNDGEWVEYEVVFVDGVVVKGPVLFDSYLRSAAGGAL